MKSIVFDVDNVLADTMNCWCLKASEYLRVKVTKDQIKHDKIVGSVPISASEVYRLQDLVWEEWANLPATEEGIPDLMSKLKNSGCSIIIATCRPTRSARLVVKWLAKNGINYDCFQALGPYRSKAEIECDMLVDDAPQQIIRIIERGGIGFLYAQPWNAGSHIPKAITIQSLSEILDHLVPEHGKYHPTT